MEVFTRCLSKQGQVRQLLEGSSPGWWGSCLQMPSFPPSFGTPSSALAQQVYLMQASLLQIQGVGWAVVEAGMLLTLFSPSLFLGPHGLQHMRLPCPSLSPGVCSNSCPLSRWCYLTISSSAAPFSFCLQSFPAPGSFPMSQHERGQAKCTHSCGLCWIWWGETTWAVSALVLSPNAAFPLHLKGLWQISSTPPSLSGILWGFQAP